MLFLLAFARKIFLIHKVLALMDLSNKTVAIIANGNIRDIEVIRASIKTKDFIIAVDGGLKHCDRLQTSPHLIIGDLDSVSGELLLRYQNIPITVFPPDKDKCDLELAIEVAFAHKARSVTIYAALEKRTDHTLNNLILLTKYPHQIYIESESEMLFAFNSSVTIPTYPGQTISFFPLLEPIQNVKSKGLKWEIHPSSFAKQLISLSNIATQDSVLIEMEKGCLICCLQKQESIL